MKDKRVVDSSPDLDSLSCGPVDRGTRGEGGLWGGGPWVGGPVGRVRTKGAVRVEGGDPSSTLVLSPISGLREAGRSRGPNNSVWG